MQSRSLLAPLALVCAGTLIRPAPALDTGLQAPACAFADIRVRSGEARLHGTYAEETLRPGQPSRKEPGPARLVLPPLSEVQLSWPGRMTLTLHGPCELSFEGALDGAAPVRARLERGGDLDLELRAGALWLELGSSLRLVPTGGAVHVGHLPGGAFEVEHRGGPPLVLEPLERRPAGSFPAKLYPGQRVRL